MASSTGHRLSRASSPAVDPADDVVIPQLYLLRLLQLSLGVEIQHLEPHYLGIAAPYELHHVCVSTSRVDGKCSFRVRTCKHCSKDGKRVDLGTYSCVGDALLVNDMWQLVHGDAMRAHTLVPGDELWAKFLHVRKLERRTESVICIAKLPSLAASSSRNVSLAANPSAFTSSLKGTRLPRASAVGSASSPEQQAQEHSQSPSDVHFSEHEDQWNPHTMQALPSPDTFTSPLDTEQHAPMAKSSERLMAFESTCEVLETLLSQNLLFGADVMLLLTDSDNYAPAEWTLESPSRPRALIDFLFSQRNAPESTTQIDDHCNSCGTATNVQRCSRFVCLESAREAAQGVILRVCTKSICGLPEHLVRHLTMKLEHFFELNVMEPSIRELFNRCSQTLASDPCIETEATHKYWHMLCERVDLCVLNCWTELWLLLSTKQAPDDVLRILQLRTPTLHDLFVLLNDVEAHHFTKRSKERIALLQVNYVAALAFGYDTYAYNTYVTPLLRCALQAMATMANEIRTLPAQVRLLLHAALLKLLVAQRGRSNDHTIAKMDQLARELHLYIDQVFTTPLEALHASPALALTQAEARIVCVTPLILYFIVRYPREAKRDSASTPSHEYNIAILSTASLQQLHVVKQLMLDIAELLSSLATACTVFSTKCVLPFTLSCVRELYNALALNSTVVSHPISLEQQLVTSACMQLLDWHADPRFCGGRTQAPSPSTINTHSSQSSEYVDRFGVDYHFSTPKCTEKRMVEANDDDDDGRWGGDRNSQLMALDVRKRLRTSSVTSGDQSVTTASPPWDSSALLREICEDEKFDDYFNMVADV